ncbi:MAG TPA: hypothetical protein VIG41_03395 [Micrococcaceae bacterium]|jgi:hypothetical protein
MYGDSNPFREVQWPQVRRASLNYDLQPSTATASESGKMTLWTVLTDRVAKVESGTD